MLLTTRSDFAQYAKSIEREHAERGVMIRKWRGLRWLVLNTQARGSRALDAEALRQLMSGVQFDALMVWAYGTDGNINASLYHAPTEASKKLDLSVHAKAMGGGGHAGACGFRAPADWGYLLVTDAIQNR